MKSLVCRTLFAALTVTMFSLALAFSSGCDGKKDPVKPPDPPLCVGDTCDPVIPPPPCDDCDTTTPERTLDPRLILSEEGYAWKGFIGDGGVVWWAFVFKIDVDPITGDSTGAVRQYYTTDRGISNPSLHNDGSWYTLGFDIYITFGGSEAKIPYNVSGADGSVTMMLPMFGPEPVPAVFIKTELTFSTDDGDGDGDDDPEEGDPEEDDPEAGES